MNSNAPLPETDQDWQRIIEQQKGITQHAQGEYDRLKPEWDAAEVNLWLQQAFLDKALAQYETYQLRNELAALRRTLAERDAAPSPVAPVGVKPVGITHLADLIPVEPAPATPPTPPAKGRFYGNKYTKPQQPKLPEMDIRGMDWEEQVATVRRYLEEYPNATINSIAKALHTYSNKVHYIKTGKPYPSESNNTYRPLPPERSKAAPAKRLEECDLRGVSAIAQETGLRHFVKKHPDASVMDIMRATHLKYDVVKPVVDAVARETAAARPTINDVRRHADHPTFSQLQVKIDPITNLVVTDNDAA